MENTNYLSPFENFNFPVTLHRINKNIYGYDEIHLESGEKLYDYLMSPLTTYFMVVKSDRYEKINILYDDIVVIERKILKSDGPAAVIIDNILQIKSIQHNREFCTICIEDLGFELIEGKDFNHWGTISYVLRSEDKEYLKICSEDLFEIY